jgi:hypothetical protein
MQSTGRDDFAPIRNPYIVGNPIEDRRMFFGREEDFEYIRNKVAVESRGGLLVLCGTRRSGKTSILFQIRDGRLGPGFVPVLIDMQSVTVRGDSEFLVLLQHEICLAMTRHGLRCPQLPQGPNPHASFQAFTEELQSHIQGNRLVLMFDEYELFETQIFKDKFSTDVLNLLASWMESRAGIFMIFTGSEKLEARDAAYWQHFLGKALHRRISFLSPSDTRRLIQEPARGVVEYADGVVDEICRLTAGQPFYTQVICQALIDRLSEIRSRRVSPEILERVVEDIVDNPLPQMIFTWSSASAPEKATMAILAELSRQGARSVPLAEFLAYQNTEKVPAGLGMSSLQESLERLFHTDLLDKSPAGNAYLFRMDLWRRWIARMHSIWQVMDEIGAVGRRSRAKAWPRIAAALGLVAVVTLAGLLWLGRRGPPVISGVQGGLAIATADSTTVSLRTEPAGALAWLGELFLGRTPVVGRRVLVTRAVLRLELAGYRDHEDTLALEKGSPADISVALTPRTGGLRLASEPPGAAVWLGGKDSGRRTPCQFPNLRAGQAIEVELQLAGFEAWRLPTVRIEPDSVIAVDVRFNRRRFPLTIMSSPREATVSLDGLSVGRTPLSLAAVEEGRHVLILVRDGYVADTVAVAVPAPSHQLEISLRKLPSGFLVVEIDPYADVWIDGRRVAQGVVNGRYEIDPGDHTIELRHPLKTVTLQVSVNSGEVRTVKQSLR